MAEIGVKPRQRIMLPFLDGMRGIASLAVALFHIWQFAIASPVEPSPAWFRPFNVLGYGDRGVAVFLVISGYCLMLPVSAHGESRLPIPIREFAARRARRVLPGYYAVLASSILLVAVVPELGESTTGTPWDLTGDNLSATSIGTHVFAVHNWFESYRWSLNPPLWSVALELQIYVAFAFALLPIARRVGTATTVLVSMGISIGLNVVGFGFVAPWMLGLFAVGMLCADITAGGRRAGPADAWLAVGTIAAAIVLVAVFDDFPFLNETAAGVGTGVLICLLASPGDAGFPIATARSFLSSGPLRTLGDVSYSIYLVHYPIVAAVDLAIVRENGWNVPQNFAALILIAGPLIALASWGSYRFVEQPFLRRRG